MKPRKYTKAEVKRIVLKAVKESKTQYNYMDYYGSSQWIDRTLEGKTIKYPKI